MASMTEVAGYAYQAGLRNPPKIAMAVAIAMAESGLNPSAHNTKGEDSRGLWQINVRAHPPASLGIGSADALYDPLVNARAMVKISNSGSNWKAWTTWPLRAGAFLPAATAATAVFLASPTTVADQVVGSAQNVADATGVGALTQTVSEAVQTPLKVANWLTEPGTWVRISLFALGGAMIVGGVLIFARPAVSSVAGAAAAVLPAGKVGSLIKGAS